AIGGHDGHPRHPGGRPQRTGRQDQQHHRTDRLTTLGRVARARRGTRRILLCRFGFGCAHHSTVPISGVKARTVRAAATALSTAIALLTDSLSSYSGSESATMPPPACTY